MNPLAALTFNNTLGTEDHAVVIRLGECLKNGLNLLNCKLLGSFLAERGEYLICVVMMVIVIMASTVAMLVMIMVMMLVLVVTVAAALAMLIMIVMVVLVVVVTVAAALTMLIVVVVVMLVVMVLVATALTMLVVIVVVMLMLVVTVAAALTGLVMIVVMMLMVVVTVATALTVLVVVVVVVMVVLFLKSLYRILNGVLMLHSKENILTVKEIPGGCHDNSISIVLTKETNALRNLLIPCALRMREDDGGSVLDLVVIELAKVLHIHLALINVGNGGKAVKSCTVLLGSLCRANNVRELTNA